MNLIAALTYLASHKQLDRNENTAFRCEASKRFEDAGDYQAAAEVLGERWTGPGNRPELSDLDERTGTLLLLRVGMLSHRIAVTQSTTGVQDSAKDLLSEAQRVFASLGDPDREAEATVGVALCQWRKSEIDAARITLRELLDGGRELSDEVRASALVALGYVEWSAENDDAALAVFRESEELLGRCDNHRLRAGYHSGFALVWRRFGETDKALIENAAASHHLERAGDLRQCALLENNVGNLLADARRFNDAHHHFNRAHALYLRLSDRINAARVDDSRAQAHLAADDPEEAEPFARRAVKVLREVDDRKAYIESLVTLGTVLARASRGAEAWAMFESAREESLESLGAAAAANIEETARNELAPLLFSSRYFDAYRQVQAALIRKALRETNWNVKKAALRLGMKQQGLDQLLDGTHKKIMEDKPRRA